MPFEVNLAPPLFENIEDFSQSGRTLGVDLSSRSNSLAAFAVPEHLGPADNNAPEESDIYISSWVKSPTFERRVFITDTSLIFSALQSFANHLERDGTSFVRTPQIVSTLRKLAGDYITHIQECWVHAAQQTGSSTDEQGSGSGELYRSMYTSLSLFQCLYLPEDGEEDVPVGDELLEWLNIHFIEPSTEEGDLLSSLPQPWQDESFWPYLLRATLRGLLKSTIFFLKALEPHPSENLKDIAERLADILGKHPRQSQYSTEKEFFVSSRRWRDRTKALRIELDRVPENDRHDGHDDWWENISDLLGILEGRGEVLQRVCDELDSDWKEVVCTWGVWIDIGLRRADLPDLVDRIISATPPDPSDEESSLHVQLFQGEPSQALATADKIDPWLSAHLADLMLPLGLLTSEVNEQTELSTRDFYVMSYAEYLQTDPALWRLTVSYLSTCGEIGKGMADEVLLRVPLGLEKKTSKPDSRPGSTADLGDNMDQDDQDDLSDIVKELSAMCFEYRREETRRMICKIAAQKLVELKRYGLAVSYSRSAEDWLALDRIVDRLLDEYITRGPSHFANLVTDVAPSFQEPQVTTNPQDISVYRWIFAIRYAEFHQRKLIGDAEGAAFDLIVLLEEGIVPKPWWGALLYDAISLLQDETSSYFTYTNACLLLRHLEEISLRTNLGCGGDYLAVLARILRVQSPQDALKRLDVLRLVLARYLARCISKPVPIMSSRIETGN